MDSVNSFSKGKTYFWRCCYILGSKYILRMKLSQNAIYLWAHTVWLQYLGQDVVDLWIHESSPVSVLRHSQHLGADLWKGWSCDVHVSPCWHGQQWWNGRPTSVTMVSVPRATAAPSTGIFPSRGLLSQMTMTENKYIYSALNTRLLVKQV